MKKYKASQWRSYVKSTKGLLPPSANLLVAAAGTDVIVLTVINGDGEPVIVATGAGALYFRSSVVGWREYEVSSKKPFGACIEVNGTQTEEYNDPEEEVPPRAEPANLLQKMREEVRREMGHSRENFLEDDTGLPNYEGDDDMMFEEDEAAAMVAQREGKAQAVAEEAEQMDIEDNSPNEEVKSDE